MDKVYEYVEELRENNMYILKIVLICNAVQVAARKLYERNGFELTQRGEISYWKGLSSATLCLYEKTIKFNELN